MSAVVDFEDDVRKEHRCLNHLSLHRIIELTKCSTGMRLTLEQIKAKPGDICLVYATSRAIVRILRESACRHFDNFGDLFYADIWGLYLVRGIDGTGFYVFATDNITQKTYGLCIAKAADALNALKQLSKQIERKHNIKIKA
jgi:hypothetical protein